MTNTQHIALLQGGWSSERDVSLASGKAVHAALDALGYRVSAIDVQPDIGKVLTDLKPDCVFNALHGKFGEDGCIQGLLEILDTPYTHSGVLASGLAMHKVRAKSLFAANGLRCAEGGVFSIGTIITNPPLIMPFVVKPISDGSSVNVSVIHDVDDLAHLAGIDPAMMMLVERYIPGREIQVAVLDGKALGAIEIRPQAEFYDYESKYTMGKAEHIMPAPLDDDDYNLVLSYAEQAHNALGCRGLTRSDFRYDTASIGQNLFYLLETNTQPGMTELSLAPEIAAYHGISFTDLVQHLVQHATTDMRAGVKG